MSFCLIVRKIDHLPALYHQTYFALDNRYVSTWNLKQWSYICDSNHWKIVCSSACSVQQQKRQSSTLLEFRQGVHRWPMYSPKKASNAKSFFSCHDSSYHPLSHFTLECIETKFCLKKILSSHLIRRHWIWTTGHIDGLMLTHWSYYSFALSHIYNAITKPG